MGFLDNAGLATLVSQIKALIPTKVSQLTNDSEFLTSYTETDPTVPAWAKAETKPTYTASEVGAASSTHTHEISDVTGLQDSLDETLSTSVAYATCSTAADTAAKEVTVSNISNWKLEVGATVVIKFSYTNTASNCTLNVNGTGAKQIWYNNTVYTGSDTTPCGFVNRYLTYMYDGTYWVWITHSRETDTTYTVATSSKNGLLSSTDKAKLDSLSGGITVSDSEPTALVKDMIWIGTA